MIRSLPAALGLALGLAMLVSSSSAEARDRRNGGPPWGPKVPSHARGPRFTPPGHRAVPELDPASSAGALGLLASLGFVLRRRRETEAQAPLELR